MPLTDVMCKRQQAKMDGLIIREKKKSNKPCQQSLKTSVRQIDWKETQGCDAIDGCYVQKARSKDGLFD